MPPISRISESKMGTNRRTYFDVTMSAVTRRALLAFLPILPPSLAAAEGQPGALDPVFSQLPFEQWLNGQGETHMHWSAKVTDPQLSPHQRLVANVFVQVDGGELARLRGKGRFLVLLQVTDNQSHVWQNHLEINLKQMKEGVKGSNAELSQQFFVLPGDYSVSIAVYSGATGDHSTLTRRLHVTGLRNDPLPDAWRDLPAVEFIPSQKDLDGWLLSSTRSRLQLADTSGNPARVDLIVNLTPAEQFAGSSRIQNRNFGVLLPSTRVLSQVDWGAAEFTLRLLDISRHRIAYQHDGGSDFDWSGTAASLTGINPGIIDARSLERRRYSADFFVNQIRLRIHAAARSGKQSAVIVLSAPVQFKEGQDLRPLTFSRPPNVRVYYIRYQPPPEVVFGPPIFGRPPRAIRSDFVAVDQLEPLLRTLEPRLFDVRTPEQFRKALATILGEISRL